MPKRSKDSKFDVSGDVDERGRFVNRDVPDDARRGAKTGKKKRTSADAKKERVAKLVADAEEAPKKKRSHKKKKPEDDLDLAIAEKPKRSHKKKKADGEAAPKEPKKKRVREKKIRAVDGDATMRQVTKLVKRKEKLDKEFAMVPLDKNTDEFDSQYREMFENLQTIIGLFEDKMLDNPNGRDVYALSTLYSQMREVIADIRSAKDVSQQILELENRAYGSFLTLVGQSFVHLFYQMHTNIKATVKSRDQQEQLIASLKGLCKDESDKIQLGYQAMLERVRTVLT